MRKPKEIIVLALLALFIELGSATQISCAANCKTCWSALAANCMSCDTGYILKSFECVLANVGCLATYALDSNDNRCKRTITDTQNACIPSKFNQNTGAQAESSC